MGASPINPMNVGSFHLMMITLYVMALGVTA